MDDSTKVGLAIQSFDKLLDKALHTSPQGANGDGYSFALAFTLCGAALCLLALVWLAKIVLKRISDKDAEAAAREAELKGHLANKDAEAVARETELKKELASKERDFKAEARAESERTERLAREERERESNAARERARADQADRESARDKLTHHVSAAIDKLKAWLDPFIARVDASIGALQGRIEHTDRDIVSLKKDLEHALDRIKKLEEGKK